MKTQSSDIPEDSNKAADEVKKEFLTDMETMTTAEKYLCTYCESVADPNGNVTEGLYEVTSEDLVRFSNTENKEKVDFDKWSDVWEILNDNPGISSYAIAKQPCTDGCKFNSFKVKITRIVKRISNSSNIPLPMLPKK